MAMSGSSQNAQKDLFLPENQVSAILFRRNFIILTHQSMFGETNKKCHLFLFSKDNVQRELEIHMPAILIFCRRHINFNLIIEKLICLAVLNFRLRMSRSWYKLYAERGSRTILKRQEKDRDFREKLICFLTFLGSF